MAHRALQLDPQFGFVAALAGVCHLQRVLFGRVDGKEAVRLFRLALSIDDGDPETSALAALTSAFMIGDNESEIEMADRAVALNPNSFAAWNCRGQLCRIAGLPEEALRSWEQAVRMSCPSRIGFSAMWRPHNEKAALCVFIKLRCVPKTSSELMT